MRSIWKGHIQFSLVTIPIRIFSAVDSAESVQFNQLHRDCNGRVGYDKKCKKCENPVPNDDIVKGYEYEPDQYVVFGNEDFDKVKIKSSKVIELEGFVEASEIHPMWYDTPYYVGPDGEVAGKTYGLLRETLASADKLGIGRVVLRDREEIVILGTVDDGLVMYKLRNPATLRNIAEVPKTGGAEAEPEQVKLANTLVDSMSTTIGDLDLTDRYKDAVKEMVTAKVEGKEVLTVVEEAKPVVDIMTALRESISQAKGSRKPMERAKKEPAAAKKKKAAPKRKKKSA
jgi:DNA end-binding protein Ku